MPVCFVSYASADVEFANGIAAELGRHGVDTFLAAVSMDPGMRWSDEILNALRASKWVVFLASKAAIAAPYVQQEVGGAVVARKNLVPVVWEISPGELPGWSKEFQAIDMRGDSPDVINDKIEKLARRIMAGSDWGFVLGGAIVMGFLWLASRSAEDKTGEATWPRSAT